MPNKQEFGQWKQDPITKAVLTWARRGKEQIEAALLSEALILKEGGQLKLSNLAGMRDVLDRVLNLSVEDLEDEEETESTGL